MKVEITWEDAVVDEEITQDALYDNELNDTLTVKTAGYLIGENERVVNVALSKQPRDRKFVDVLTIPKCCIREIKEL